MPGSWCYSQFLVVIFSHDNLIFNSLFNNSENTFFPKLKYNSNYDLSTLTDNNLITLYNVKESLFWSNLADNSINLKWLKNGIEGQTIIWNINGVAEWWNSSGWDLSNYYIKTEIDTLLNTKLNTTWVLQDININRLTTTGATNGQVLSFNGWNAVWQNLTGNFHQISKIQQQMDD